MKPFILAACDTLFYEEWGKSLANSAKAHGMEALVHCSGEFAGKDNDKRAYHCALRFLLLPDLLKEHKAVLVLDVDSLITAPIEFRDDIDLGLFLRLDAPDTGGKVLNTAMYVKNTALAFAENLKHRLECRIESGDTPWYYDQEEAWHAFLHTRCKKYRVLSIGTDLVNWDDVAPVYTGKGRRKFEDHRFMALNEKWRRWGLATK